MNNKIKIKNLKTNLKIYHVMKKQFFSLVMMLALVIVAGSAFGQTNVTPFRGGTYNYSLSGIKVNTAGTATIVYSGGSGATIQNVSLGTSSPYPVPTDLTTLTFQVKYADDATAGKIVVTVTDGATNGCSNFIELAITPQALPTIALSILASEDQYCQIKTDTPENNIAASSGQTNTITFTVSPNIANVNSTPYTYTYSIDLPGDQGLTNYNVAYAGPGTYSGGVVSGASTTANGVFTITFNTTTGLAPININGTLSAASMTVTSTSGTGVYTGTFSPASDVVNVKTMPSIGQFTIE